MRSAQISRIEAGLWTFPLKENNRIKSGQGLSENNPRMPILSGEKKISARKWALLFSKPQDERSDSWGCGAINPQESLRSSWGLPVTSASAA
jgi:hypothetical protein